jgi:hypothetical protein
MSIPADLKKKIEKRLDRYCREKIPADMSRHVRLSYGIRGNDVNLAEERPLWCDPLSWVNMPVAKFRFDPANGKWRLYYLRPGPRPGAKWRAYPDLSPRASIEDLIREIDTDPAGAFWR